MSIAPDVAAIDVHVIAPQERHETMFATFDTWAADKSFDLPRDHEHRPLYDRFLPQWPRLFGWDALEFVPAQSRIRMGRQAAGNSSRCSS